MSLYKMRTFGDEYQITKLTDDLDMESSYTVSENVCDCPAGHRDTCRHRQMFPEFVETAKVDTPWLYDFDNQTWYYYDAENGRMLTEAPTASKRGLFEQGLRRRI